MRHFSAFFPVSRHEQNEVDDLKKSTNRLKSANQNSPKSMTKVIINVLTVITKWAAAVERRIYVNLNSALPHIKLWNGFKTIGL